MTGIPQSQDSATQLRQLFENKRISETQAQRIRGSFFPFLIPLFIFLMANLSTISIVLGVIGTLVSMVNETVGRILMGLSLVLGGMGLLMSTFSMAFSGIHLAGSTLFKGALEFGSKVMGSIASSALFKTFATVAFFSLAGEGLKRLGVPPIVVSFIQSAAIGFAMGGPIGAVTSLVIQGTSYGLAKAGLPPALVSVCSIAAGALVGAAFSPDGFISAVKTQVLRTCEKIKKKTLD